MTAGKRGLISLAAAVFLALSSVLPAYAQEEMPDELETAETIPEQNSDPPADEPAKPPETPTQTDPYYEENNASSSEPDKSNSDLNQKQADGSAAEADETQSNAAQANQETNNEEAKAEEGLELKDDEVSLILKSNPDHSSLSRIEDYENDDINALAKANEQNVVFMAAYEIGPKLPDQSVEFKAKKSLLENIDYDELELYSIDNDKIEDKDRIESVASGKEIKTNPDSIEASFDAKSLGLLVFAALKKSDKKANSLEEEPMALANDSPVTVYVKEPNDLNFTQADQANLPITKTVDGQLYMLSDWYSDEMLSASANLEEIAAPANLYAAYVAAAEFNIQTIINSTNNNALSKTYAFTATASDPSGSGTPVIRPSNASSSSNGSSTVNVSLEGQRTSQTFYVTAGADVTVTEADYSTEGYSEYYGANSKFSITDPGTNVLSSGPVNVPASSTGNNRKIFSFLNSLKPYLQRTRLYSYGKLPDGSWVGLGLATGTGMKLPDSSYTTASTLDLNSVTNAQLSIEYPNQRRDQSPVNPSIQLENGYPKITDGGIEYTYVAPDSADAGIVGHYTITWNTLSGGNPSVEAGSNGYYNPSSDSNRTTYRLNGTINLGNNYNITVKVRQPDSQTFTDLSGYAPKKVQKGTSLSGMISGLQNSVLPATKEVNGRNYELLWYADENLTQPLDQNQPVDSTKTIYAVYKQYFTVRYFTKEYDGNWSDTPVLTEKRYPGDPLAPLETPASTSINGLNIGKSKILSYWYTSEACTTKFNFNGTITSNIDLYAKFENAVKVTITKETNPANLTGPFTIHANGGSSQANGGTEYAQKAPIRVDPTSVTNGTARQDGVDRVLLTLNDGQNGVVWLPMRGQLQVIEDNTNGYVQKYRWGNFVGDLSSLETAPLNVEVSAPLTIFNSNTNTPKEPIYFYGYVSGSGTYYELGSGTISGPLVFPADQTSPLDRVNNYSGVAVASGQFQAFVTDFVKPTSYPKLTIDGKEYSYGRPTTRSMAANGYYTIDWEPPVTVQSSVVSSPNDVFNPTSIPYYRQNAVIQLHEYTTFTLDSKNVDGTGDANPDDEITYRFQFSPPTGNTDPIIISTDGVITSHNVNEYTIKLKSGQSAQFSVPIGSYVSVTDEVNQNLYTPSWKISGATPEPNNTSSFLRVPLNNPTTISFANTRNLVVPTNFESKSTLPYLLLLSMLAGLFLLMTRRKKT